MAAETFFILRGPGEAENVFKNSRFLGLAGPCATPADAAAFLARAREAHPKATHHVPAWRLRDARTGLVTHRHDDDGEPGGTAGRPVLQAMEAQHVVGAALVVVRYFGGIKLGAGGLVRAYAATAAAALQAAGLVPLVLTRRIAIEIEYALVASVLALIAREGLAVVERSFEGRPRLVVDVPCDDLEPLRHALQELTAGRAAVLEIVQE